MFVKKDQLLKIASSKLVTDYLTKQYTKEQLASKLVQEMTRTSLEHLWVEVMNDLEARSEKERAA